LIAAVATFALPAGPAADAAYKLRGQPVVYFQRGQSSHGFVAKFRLNRQAPRRPAGAPVLGISLVGGELPDYMPVSASPRSRACYEEDLQPGRSRRLAHPRTGMRVVLQIIVGRGRDAPKLTTSVKVRGVDHYPPRPSKDPALIRLGCVKG